MRGRKSSLPQHNDQRWKREDSLRIVGEHLYIKGFYQSVEPSNEQNHKKLRVFLHRKDKSSCIYQPRVPRLSLTRDTFFRVRITKLSKWSRIVRINPGNPGQVVTGPSHSSEYTHRHAIQALFYVGFYQIDHFHS